MAVGLADRASQHIVHILDGGLFRSSQGVVHLNFEVEISNFHFIALFQFFFPVNLFPVDERAVLATEVPQPDVAGVHDHDAMVSANHLAARSQMAIGITSDQKFWAGDGNLRTVPFAAHD